MWKLRCGANLESPPQVVVQKGGGRRTDEAAMSMYPYQGRLYVGSGVPLGFNPMTRHGPHGCSVISIDADGRRQEVVGPARAHPLSGYGPGFGWYLNAYCWYMAEHQGYLYLGTWDISRAIEYLGQDAEKVAPAFAPLLGELAARPHGWGSPVGGDLYRTADGLHWEPVFLNGLGNPDNHGIRTLESTPLGFFVGTENPFTRLEVWQLQE